MSEIRDQQSEGGMSKGEQVDAFADELERLIDRYSAEFDLTVAEALGVLHLAMHALAEQAFVKEDEY